MLLAAALLLAAPLAPQTPELDAKRRTPLLRPPPGAPPAEAPAPPSAEEPLPPARVEFPAQADPDSGPRPVPSELAPPFETDRPLFEVDGAVIRAAELNELVAYYRSFRPGAADLLLMDAVAALLPQKTLAARFASELPAMRERAEQARAALQTGRPFAEVVKEWSDDGEAEDPEGKYTFGRERAVQPFDRVAFTQPPGGGLSGPWLTVYGWHLIEPLAYERGVAPKDDRATMRHVLVMYSKLRELERSGADVRAWIREQVAAAKIRVLEPGLRNLVPPERRGQIVP